MADLREQRRTSADHHYEINPTLKEVRDRLPVFVFPGKSGKNTAVVRRCSPIFAPTVAKTVAITTPVMVRWFDLYPLLIEPVYKGELWEIIQEPRDEHQRSTTLKHVVVETGKEVAEAVRDIVVTIAEEAVKRGIWG